MADNYGSRRGNPPQRQSEYATRSPAHNARQRASPAPHSRPVSRTSHVDHVEEGARSPAASLRSMDSRFSLRETFAASRREIEFEDDDEDGVEVLEPAPVISEIPDVSQTSDGEIDEDEISEIDETEIQRLLYATDYDSFDYYTLLGLSRDPAPTTSQIRGAYHRLSLAFHPDKHPQSMKAAAERYFTRLQKAYETLIHPQKKVIYDLEGDEGLRMEYMPGGAMGKGGNAERLQIGVKTMDSNEFKRWFIKILKDRERAAIHELTGSMGTLKLSLDATNAFDGSDREQSFRPLENDGPPIVVVTPLVYITNMKLSQSFGVPLPGLAKLLQAPFPTANGAREEEKEDDDSELKSDWTEVVNQHVPKLSFSGGIGGELDTRIAVYSATPGETQPGFIAPAPVSWHGLTTDSIRMAASIEHTFPEIAGAQKSSRSISSLLSGFDLAVSTDVLPKRTFNVGLGRGFNMGSDTKTFYAHVQTSFNQSLLMKPPAFDVRVSKSFGGAHTGYISWQSGDFPWPSSWSHSPLWLPRGRLFPTMKIGYLRVENGPMLRLDEDSDTVNPDSKEEQIAQAQRSSSNSSWHVAASASPFNASASVTYGRDVFNPLPEPPVLSRIMENGDVTSKIHRPRLTPTRGVRLEVESELGMDMAWVGTVRGVRRFGDFTNLGVGIGVQRRGLFISFSWSRLGQSIVVPVILVPQAETTSSAIFYALAIPWATYAAVEFVVLRPRQRAKRQRLVDRKRRELAQNVANQKAEAEQAVQLMRPLVETRQAYERDDNGLVILKATWGVPASGRKGEMVQFKAGECADVTVPLAALVDDGQLGLPRGLNKSQVTGFWDPSPLKAKVLVVEYMFGGKTHRAEARGKSALSIPRREHEV